MVGLVDLALLAPVMGWEGVWEGGPGVLCARCGQPLRPGEALDAYRRFVRGIAHTHFTHKQCPVEGLGENQ
jgi:hypothetical protein